MSTRIDPARTRQIFSQNLRALCKTTGNISETSRAIGVNRTQFNRYLNGEAFPRPDVLNRICSYFETDARILTTPLNELVDMRAPTVDSHFAPAFQPASHTVLPDGFYEEWKLSWMFQDVVSLHLMLIKTIDGMRWTRIIASDTSRVSLSDRRWMPPLVAYRGQAFSQSTGFFTLDRGAGMSSLAFTIFRQGYFLRDDLYVGYKVSGAAFHQHRQLGRGAVVLHRLPAGMGPALASARKPVYHTFPDVPPDIMGALNEVRQENARNVLPPFPDTDR